MSFEEKKKVRGIHRGRSPPSLAGIKKCMSLSTTERRNHAAKGRRTICSGRAAHTLHVTVLVVLLRQDTDDGKTSDIGMQGL